MELIVKHPNKHAQKYEAGSRLAKQEKAATKRAEIRQIILNKLQEYLSIDIANGKPNSEGAFKSTDEWIQAWVKREPQQAQLIKQETIMVRNFLKGKLKQ